MIVVQFSKNAEVATPAIYLGWHGFASTMSSFGCHYRVYAILPVRFTARATTTRTRTHLTGTCSQHVFLVHYHCMLDISWWVDNQSRVCVSIIWCCLMCVVIVIWSFIFLPQKGACAAVPWPKHSIVDVMTSRRCSVQVPHNDVALQAWSSQIGGFTSDVSSDAMWEAGSVRATFLLFHHISLDIPALRRSSYIKNTICQCNSFMVRSVTVCCLWCPSLYLDDHIYYLSCQSGTNIC